MALSDLDDKTLVNMVLKGRSSAFEDLLKKYHDRVYRLAFRLLGNTQDAEDVIQDVFTQVYLSLKSFKGNSSFYTWLFRITYNVSITHRRKRKNVISLQTGQGTDSAPEIALASDGSAPDLNLDREESKALVEKALGMLSIEHRACLIFKEVEGLSYEEIADSLEIPVGTVRSRLFRARLELRDILQKLGGTETK